MKKYKWPLFESTLRQGEADFYCQVLQQNNIDFLLDKAQSNFNPITGQSVIDLEFIIRIQQQDFERANALILEELVQSIQLDEDYYLHYLSDNELIQLLVDKDKLSRFDEAGTIQLLRQRHVVFEEEVAFKRKTLIVPFQPKQIEPLPLMLSYVLLAALPMYSIVAGILYRHATDTDRDGNRHRAYNEDTRKHGSTLIIFGTIILCAYMYLLLKKS